MWSSGLSVREQSVGEMQIEWIRNKIERQDRTNTRQRRPLLINRILRTNHIYIITQLDGYIWSKVAHTMGQTVKKCDRWQSKKNTFSYAGSSSTPIDCVEGVIRKCCSIYHLVDKLWSTVLSTLINISFCSKEEGVKMEYEIEKSLLYYCARIKSKLLQSTLHDQNTL